MFDATSKINISAAATKVFYLNRNSKARFVINRGGAGSSKSHSVAQLLMMRFATYTNYRLLIIRRTLPSLKDSTFPVCRDFLQQWGVLDLCEIEKKPMNYYFGSNWLKFASVDNADKIRSQEWNDIWFEEATDFPFNDFKTIYLRGRKANENKGAKNQIFLTFNPVDENHWIKTGLIDSKEYDIEEIVSSHIDNPYFPDDAREDLENLIRQDRNFYRVYCLGEWGKLENLIYSNWEILKKDAEIPKDLPTIYGLDFGFSNSETALIEMKVNTDKNEIYAKQIIYKKELLTSELAALMLKNIRRSSRIYADSAEPDRIKELKKAGFGNIKLAKKSVLDGIDKVKLHHVYVHPDSSDLIREIQGYSWKSGRDGIVRDEPVKFRDHLMDAMRYGIHTHLKKRDIRFRWVA